MSHPGPDLPGTHLPDPGRPGADRPATAGRSRLARWSVFALCAAMGAGLALVLVRPSDGPDGPARATSPAVSNPVAPGPQDAASGQALRSAALTDLLKQRSQALMSGDEAAWLRTSDARVRATSARRFARLDRVPWERADFTVLGDAAPPSTLDVARWGPGVWRADVQFAYRLPGDTRDVRRRRVVTVHPVDGAWRIVADAPGAGPRDLWDLGDIRVLRGSRGLVIGPAARSGLASDLRQLERAVRRVDDVWHGSGPSTVTVVVPEDTHAMARVLGRSSTTGLAQIAAVTSGEVDRDDASATADRIVVNPGSFDGFNAAERRIVLTHEVTHVMVRRASSTATPIWVDEGFADWVAYRGSGLGREEIAGDLLAKVRDGWTLGHLPEEAEFDPARGEVAPAYAAAWLAVDRLARRYGRDALVRFVRIAAGVETDPSDTDPSDTGRPAGSTAVDRAFHEVTGKDRAAFEADWIAAVNRLARGG